MAFRAAMQLPPPAARVQALADFVKTYPDSPLRDRPMIERARALPDPMVNADGNARARFYAAPGLLAVVDGDA